MTSRGACVWCGWGVGDEAPEWRGYKGKQGCLWNPVQDLNPYSVPCERKQSGEVHYVYVRSVQRGKGRALSTCTPGMPQHFVLSVYVTVL